VSERYTVETVYTCNFCNRAFAFEEHAEEHALSCILNPLDFHGSTTDRNVKILLKAPNEKSNGYKNPELLSYLGTKNVLVEDDNKGGYKELKEKYILKENKFGYQPLEKGETQETIRSNAWQKQIDLVAGSVEEQREINESIEEFWDDIKFEVDELREKGLSEKDLAKELKEKYNLKE